MRFVLGYGLNDIHHMADVAKAAEAAGFDSFTFGDSLFYPKHTDSIYPYKGGDRSFLENIDFLDPTAAIASLGVSVFAARRASSSGSPRTRTPSACCGPFRGGASARTTARCRSSPDSCPARTRWARAACSPPGARW